MDEISPEPTWRDRVARTTDYLSAHALWVAFVTWFIFSVCLIALGGIDLTLPCLFSALVGMRCPGCGTTTAVIALLQLQPLRAWDANPLTFIVMPGLVYFAIKDWLAFTARPPRSS